MSEVKIKVVEDLPGVGPAIADKLREAGYDTLEAIGTQAPGTLSDATGIGKESCAKFVLEARKAADIGSFLTGTELMEKRGYKPADETFYEYKDEEETPRGTHYQKIDDEDIEASTIGRYAR